MKNLATTLAIASVLAACAGEAGDGPPANDVADSAEAGAGPVPMQPTQGGGNSGWDLQSSGEGVALALGPGAEVAIRLYCAAGARTLLVNVPSFSAVASEDRLSFGSGGDVVAMVADPSGDAQRGGVSATGPVPDNLDALLSGPVSASYGAQTSGPHQAPPEQLARDFIGACRDAGAPSPDAPSAPEPVSACLTQDGRRISANRLKAVGTEPFWAAEISGRCVTYSTPEDQAGTRVWAQFSGSRQRGTWTGYFDKQRFRLTTRPQQGCSDGMSDKVYPIAVEVTVRGETRRGCAEPL